jgi:hypothetical protein
MSRLISGLAYGAAAGAAGTTALNAVTYLDMALRGRPASITPEQSVEKMAEQAGVTIPGDEETRQNRVSGLGPLMGLLTGTSTGSVAGALRALGVRLPLPVGAALVGAGAMIGANAPLVRMGLTDPREWGVSGWLSDLAPHVAYGLVTAATAHRLLP